jgi:4-amino-4-deoxy-L-arabinose transferase-like glycosyltransferase
MGAAACAAWGLPFLLVLGTLLFFRHASAEGMFVDGTCYAALGRNAAEEGAWLVPTLSPDLFPRFFEHPPTFIAFEGLVFHLLGASWATARLCVLVFALALVAALWTFLRHEVGRRAAFFGALLLMLTWPFLRWCRFPNLDVPTALFSCLCLFDAWRATTRGPPRLWLRAGLFFGLALLVKGIFALHVPLAILLFLLLSGRLSVLRSPRPWLALVLGLALFALWPLALALRGDLDGFRHYLEAAFAKSAGDVGGTNPANYLLTLVTRAGPQLALATGAIVMLRRRGAPPAHPGVLALCGLLAVYLPLEIQGADYAHWLVLAYPHLAMLAGIGAAGLPARVCRAAARAAWVGSAVGLLLTATVFHRSGTVRNPETVEFLHLSRRVATTPDTLTCVGACVGDWGFVSAVEFTGCAPARLLDRAGFEAELRVPDPSMRRVMLVAETLLADLSPDLVPSLEARYAAVARYPARGLRVLADRRLAVDGVLLREASRAP